MTSLETGLPSGRARRRAYRGSDVDSNLQFEAAPYHLHVAFACTLCLCLVVVGALVGLLVSTGRL